MTKITQTIRTILMLGIALIITTASFGTAFAETTNQPSITIRTNQTIIELAELEYEAGTTPDDLFYVIDTIIDDIDLLLSQFGGAESQIKTSLEIARERMAETELMARNENFDAMAIAAEEHNSVLNTALENIPNIKNSNISKEMELEVEIEIEILRHITRIEQFGNDVEIKLTIEGNITDESIALIKQIINNLQTNITEIKIEIENVRTDTKHEFMKYANLSKFEVEIEIELIENNMGLISMKERAQEKIEYVNEYLMDALIDIKLTNIIDSEVLIIMEGAKEQLNLAKFNFNNENYVLAFRYALMAESLVDSVEDRIDYDEDYGYDALEELNDAKSEIRETELLMATRDITDAELIGILNDARVNLRSAELAYETGNYNETYRLSELASSLADRVEDMIDDNENYESYKGDKYDALKELNDSRVEIRETELIMAARNITDAELINILNDARVNLRSAELAYETGNYNEAYKLSELASSLADRVEDMIDGDSGNKSNNESYNNNPNNDFDNDSTNNSINDFLIIF
ncbi:MAG: hypothetical protein HF967_06620 [Methanosarcinales archaeon]|nr:hypothetical protein [Methanosarcinales archaeon]